MYNDPATWRLSRDFLEQQIRILRVQLDELKVIRKHLRAMRPDKSQVGNSKQRTNSKSKVTGSLFDWSSPPSANRTVMNTSDAVYQQPPSGNRRKQHPKAPVIEEVEEEDEEEDDDNEEEEEEPSGGAGSSGPVETIEVTIYDNRKIKWVKPISKEKFFFFLLLSKYLFKFLIRSMYGSWLFGKITSR